MQMKRKSIISSSGAHLRPTAALCGAAILSLCTVLSCAKIEVTPVEDADKGQIHYELVPVKTETKATVSEFPKTSTFGSTAWLLPEGKSWSGNSAEALRYIPEEEISYNEKEGIWKAWKSGKIYAWPITGKLTFFSWSPVSLSTATGTVKTLNVSKEKGFEINGWQMTATPGYGSEANIATDGCTDILLAQTTDVERKTTLGGVKTNFRHALCKVKFLATLATEQKAGEDKWVVKSVRLDDIYTNGNYITDKWAKHSNAQSYNHEGLSIELAFGENREIFPETMMLPQYLTNGKQKITLVCQRGTEPEKTLSGYIYNGTQNSLSAWQSGKYISYLITVGTEDSYIEFDATPGLWGFDPDSDVNIGVRP